MKNVFSTKKVTPGIRMYANKPGNQRFYSKDDRYFTQTYDIRVEKEKYTLVGFYSYAILDMYRETLSSGFCNGTTEVDTSSERAMYITVSGLISNLGTSMILDAPKSETGENPEYIPFDDDPLPPGSYEITSFLANNFVYDSGSNSYSITSFSPHIGDYNRLGEEFTVYVHNIDSLQPNSSIDLFGNKFRIYHINGEPLVTLMESVASVMPFLCNKNTGIARMIYSYISTSQTGLGLEDLFLDVDDEPFNTGGESA